MQYSISAAGGRRIPHIFIGACTSGCSYRGAATELLPVGVIVTFNPVMSQEPKGSVTVARMYFVVPPTPLITGDTARDTQP